MFSILRRIPRFRINATRQTRRPAASIATLMLAWAASGCAAPGPIHSPAAAHVVILPGIDGNNPWVERLRDAIDRDIDGVSAQIWDWTNIEPSLPVINLVDEPRNRRRARQLAESLVAWREQNPGGTLYLSAISGGTGIVLFACEQLPPDFEVERIVLLASAVSPAYDLRPALRRVRRELWSFHSREDSTVLGIGTRFWGTIDRIHTNSAGMTGFDSPAEPELAGKLMQKPWDESMRRLGHHGGHVGTLAKGFIREHLLPLFRPDGRADDSGIEPSSATVNGRPAGEGEEDQRSQ